MEISKEILLEHIHLILLFGVLALFTHWIAAGRGFFTFPPEPKGALQPQVKGMQVVIAFAIYLLLALFGGALIAKAYMRMKGSGFSLTTTDGAVIQFITLCLVLAALAVFSFFQRPTMRGVWLRDRSDPAKKIPKDFCLGVVTWFVAFPLVVVAGQICDLLLYAFFGVDNYEQLAVRFLKLSLASPLLLWMALSTIIILAPVIEEWLFRGILQNFFKGLVGKKAAILLSSLCFALFHLSASQGWGNLSLAVSLFLFACYLGFLYERQGSLFASIGLHMTFNIVSSMRIVFMPD
jgi:CAAX protease family protein